jgi:hypothetical protein
MMRAGHRDLEDTIMSDMESVRFEIARLDLRPGDILVLRFQDRLRPEAIEHIRLTMKDVAGDHRCLVLENGAELAVLTAAELKDKLAAAPGT